MTPEETLVEVYNTALHNLKTLENKLKNSSDYFWNEISRTLLPEHFI